MNTRLRLRVSGVVQGVGFRPHVYSLASRLRLAGFVTNTPAGVLIEVEGTSESTRCFMEELEAAPPPLAIIQSVTAETLAPKGGQAFRIAASRRGDDATALVAPDYAVCDDCLREFFDPADSRYRYPFINCTNCGPRYTIILGLPYDRDRTTMRDFTMCCQCQAEYDDPSNRRFHAEPTCCPVCGPRIWLSDATGQARDVADPVRECAARVRSGEIVAIKGLGGFHLACDARNPGAVQRLRERKRRWQKPFALMVRDRDTAGQLVALGPREAELLESRQAPIVLANRRRNTNIAPEVAPRCGQYGVMLPYTPLHHLLLHEGPDVWVMTSGNLSDEPIAHENDEALERLAGIADVFLLHNRPIHIRTDDSVVRVIDGRPCFLRRSRGFAPFPVDLPCKTPEAEVLALGPELKNTVCVTRGGKAFVSHHIGDLQSGRAYQAFLQAVDHLTDILDVAPETVVCDRHPDYQATRFAAQVSRTPITVQHHHAHIASVLAEHGRTEPVIGVSFDGLGFGQADEVWGGEFLVGDLSDYERRGHLQLMPQPGGDATARRPDRMAYVFLRELLGEGADAWAQELLPKLHPDERALCTAMIERGVNTPLTSSAGRLFDAVSALLGICWENTYEGQAPMELESAANPDETGVYPVLIDSDERGILAVRTLDIIAGLLEDREQGGETAVCAARFHNSLAHASAEVCGRLRKETGLGTVALSGGVFANALLTKRFCRELSEMGFDVLRNEIVPPGDGGVSLGQAAVAAWRAQCV